MVIKVKRIKYMKRKLTATEEIIEILDNYPDLAFSIADLRDRCENSVDSLQNALHWLRKSKSLYNGKKLRFVKDRTNGRSHFIHWLEQVDNE